MTQSTTISGRPNATLPLSGTERIPMDQEGAIVSAGAFVFGQPYKIASIGTTDFTLIGATANTIGLIFVAIGAGAGSGTAAVMTTVDATVQDIANFGGGGGGGTSAYVHQQLTPAGIWTINHNLGFRPSVELLDSGGQEIDGEVSHPTVNQTVVALSPATAGLARLI
jgi:hypothetical protein